MIYQIIRHDCDLDTHSYHTLGPFADRASAELFADNYELWMPTDGGYAFAAVVPAEPGQSFGQSPKDYANDLREALGR